MRKLLNTLYITNENAYLMLEGENFVCKIDGADKFKIPFDNIESVVCFSYLGVSPALMGKCAQAQIPINFISPSGKFLAKVISGAKGNVFLRVAQIEKFREKALNLTKNSIAAKFANSAFVIKRTLHDNPNLRDDSEILAVLEVLRTGTLSLYEAKSADEIRGIEGSCASAYFSVFDKLITNEKVPFKFEFRSRRPPLDPINATLSFAYTLLTSEFASALETVGLDSYIGFFHTLRSGRASLACDLVEEARALAERFVLTLLNLRILGESDFETQISGAVLLNTDGRKKFITAWQEKKRTGITHPYLKEKIELGLLPYVQSNLLAKFVRGEIDEYPAFLLK